MFSDSLRRFLASASALLIGACGETLPPPAGSFDAGRSDAATPDSGGRDGGQSCQLGEPGCVQCPGYPAARLSLTWPYQGERGKDWMVRNYVDLEPAPEEKADYVGTTGDLARTYDGHGGLDIGIANFRRMDEGVPIYASTPGTVIASVDGRFDRNFASIRDCGEGANYVDVRHDSGYLLRYFHFKKDTVAVSMGERIDAGTYLGDTGSSGCSTWPHLHLGLNDCSNRPVESFLTDYWQDPPAYTAPGRISAVVTSATHYERDTYYAHFRDPGPNPKVFAAGSPLGFGIILGEGEAGDLVEVEITDGNGAIFTTLRTELSRGYTRSYWYWNRTLSDVEGSWTAETFINGVLDHTESWTVAP